MNRAERRRQARGHHHRAHPRPAIDPDGDYAYMPAWCAGVAELAETRKRTHDGLIAMMGDTRTGGVMWKSVTGSEALDQLALMFDGAPPEMADYLRQIRAHLREWGGFLVVAFAEGMPPA